MVSQRRELSRDEILQQITISVKTIRGESTGRQLSFLDDSGGGGGDGSVTILRANVTVLLLNPFTIEHILLHLASPGYFAGCFRLIMTVSTHRNLNS